MDTPELTRYAVLIVSVLRELLEETGIDRTQPGLANVLRELDALTMRLAHRSRSAVGYDTTTRGEAALLEAQQLHEKIAAGADPAAVEREDRKWAPSQVTGPILPGMKPEMVERQLVNLSGVALLSPDFDAVRVATADPLDNPPDSEML
jgi:hypothetical protein